MTAYQKYITISAMIEKERASQKITLEEFGRGIGMGDFTYRCTRKKKIFSLSHQELKLASEILKIDYLKILEQL